ncbi:MAG: methyltransferase domain-containing protein [Acidimicrobiia bacterium]|nr:methyltransferase domain-containing protein [Acidimicrobiia bacterium]
MATPDNPEDRVLWVYSSTSATEVEARYNAWADSYDRDLTDTFDYVLPGDARRSWRNSSIPGLACSMPEPGRVSSGSTCTNKDFGTSPGSISAPECCAMPSIQLPMPGLRSPSWGEPLPFCDDVFDAMIGVGVFTDGHAPAAGLREIVRVVRPGGVVLLPIRTDILESHGFAPMFSRLVADDSWRELSVSEPYAPMPKGEPDVMTQTRIWVVN